MLAGTNQLAGRQLKWKHGEQQTSQRLLLPVTCVSLQVEDAECERGHRFYRLVLVRFKESAIKATLLSLLPPGIIVLAAAA